MFESLPVLPENIWSAIFGFIGSKTFLIATSVVFMWLFAVRVFKGMISFGRNCVDVIIKSPLKFRKVFWYFVSLVFMVGGATGASIANAKIGGRDGTLEGIVAGGVMLTIWGTLVLIAFEMNKSRTIKAEEAADSKK